MKWHHNIRAGLAYFQAVLFCIIVASGTVFMHKHKTADGRIVIHIHPYNLKQNPETNNHHHSETEIHLLDVIFQGSYLQGHFFQYEQPLITPYEVAYAAYQLPCAPFRSFSYAYLRGPPSHLPGFPATI